MLLSKLAVHYYRPDFTEGQAKSLISDMVEDLAEFAVHEVDVAIKAYRRDAKNRFFPTSGALRGIILEARKDRHESEKVSAKPLPKDCRPIMWWALPPYLWKAHWRETDIPIDEISAYQRRKTAKQKAGEPGWAEDDSGGLARKYA